MRLAPDVAPPHRWSLRDQRRARRRHELHPPCRSYRRWHSRCRTGKHDRLVDRVMARRLLTWWLVVSISGCWAEEPLIHDAFTAEQWAHLQETYKPPTPNPACPEKLDAGVNCGSA